MCWKIGRRYFISTLGLRLHSSMGTRPDPQTVILRHARTRDRDKPSIYSRYLKPNIFGFKNRTESADAAAVKRANKSRSADKSRPEPEEAMSGARRLSYAERVKELLRQEPVIPARTQAQTCQRCLTKLRIGKCLPLVESTYSQQTAKILKLYQHPNHSNAIFHNCIIIDS